MEELFAEFSDATVYFIMGAVGTALFIVRILLMLVFGMDGGDFDVDVDADGGLDAHDTGFSLFSLLSIMSFMMGAGWMGLICRMDWELGPYVSAFIAAGFGFVLMLLSSSGVYMMRRFQQEGRYDVRSCIGQVGQVYLKVPARGQGQGQVQITVQGRQKVLSAVSTGEAIESFTAVKVVDVQEPETLVVEKQD